MKLILIEDEPLVAQRLARFCREILGERLEKLHLASTQAEAGAFEIVRTVITLAKHLRLPTIAEGIETEEDVARAKAAGCEFAQGFYYSVPLSASDALNFIAHHYGTISSAGAQDASGASGIGG